MEPASGARGSAVTLAQRWALPFLRAGRQTIVFGRSRVAVEILLTGLRESLRESYGPRIARPWLSRRLPADGAARHRAWPARRRDPGRRRDERARARRGHRPAGRRRSWPATRARSRRRGSSSGGPAGGWAPAWPCSSRSGAPVDQYVIHHPEFLLEGTPEEARLDPDNLHVLLAHLRAATFELPFEPGEVFGPGRPDDLLAFLAEERQVRQADDGRWYWSSENFPASEISLRTAAPENVVIIDTTPDRPRVLGEVDLFSAQVLVHERAIYIHESVQYYVDRLEWDERKAYVHRVDVDHYTLRQPGGHAQAARGLRRGPGHGRAADPRRGHGREPRHPVQEAEVPDRRERRLGPDRPARARAPDDGLLADRRGRPRSLATRRARRGAARRRPGDPDRRLGPADGRSARPRPRHPGPLAARRGADDLPVRGRSRAGSACPNGCGSATTTSSRRPRTSSGRAAATRGCPACTGPRLEPDIDARALSPAPARRAWAPARPARVGR